MLYKDVIDFQSLTRSQQSVNVKRAAFQTSTKELNLMEDCILVLFCVWINLTDGVVR